MSDKKNKKAKNKVDSPPSEIETNNESGVIESLKKQIEELKKEVKDNLEGWHRAQADYHNLERSWSLKIKDLDFDVKTDVFKNLLPIIANFDTAISFVPEEYSKLSWCEGLKNVQSLFTDFIKKEKIEIIDSVGKDFDPNFHQAISVEKVEGIEEGQIVKEFSKGYKLNNKVIVLSKVVVSS